MFHINMLLLLIPPPAFLVGLEGSAIQEDESSISLYSWVKIPMEAITGWITTG